MKWFKKAEDSYEYYGNDDEIPFCDHCGTLLWYSNEIDIKEDGTRVCGYCGSADITKIPTPHEEGPETLEEANE